MTKLRSRYVILRGSANLPDGSILEGERFLAVDRKTDDIVVIGHALPKPVGANRWQDGADEIVGKKTFDNIAAMRQEQVENQLSRLVKGWQKAYDDAAWDAPALPAASAADLQAATAGAPPSRPAKRGKKGK